jgi:SAM-dependent methyltransferase
VCGSADCARLGPPAHHVPATVAGVAIDVSDLHCIYYRCRACGYEFIDPPVPAERLLDCYRRSAGQHWATDVSVASSRRYEHKRDLLLQFAPGRRVLDFGCYDGGFLDFLGPEFDRNGIEPSTSAAQRAQQRGVNVLGPTVESVDPAAIAPFDAIIIFDVMEHLTDPIGTLTALQKLLRPGGIMLIETGNTDAPEFRKYGPRYCYAAVVEHVGFFNSSSIAEAGRRAGLELSHFERSRHSEWPSRPVRNRLQNWAYGLLRTLWRMHLPLPARMLNVARGPVPRVLDLIDHFLAVLRKPQ